MKIVFSCGGKLVPASRFRVEPLVAHLRRSGHQVRVIYGYGERDNRFRNLRLRKLYRVAARLWRAVRTMAVSRSEILVVQRLAIPLLAWPELVAARRGVPIIFDFDDAIFMGNGRIGNYLRRAAFEQVTRNARAVVAGNQWLAGKVSANADVRVLATCIDTKAYCPLEGEEPPVPTIGWMGTSGNLQYLRQLIPAFAALRREGFAFKVLLCSDVRDDKLLEALGADFVYWSAEQEVAILNAMSIGLMPLQHDDWSRGKCSFKIIQYMAVGIPAVASAVGFNCDAIAEGKTGLLVPEGGDWADPLRHLLKDARLRSAMGRAARERAVSRFDIAVAERSYADLLEEVPRQLQVV